MSMARGRYYVCRFGKYHNVECLYAQYLLAECLYDNPGNTECCHADFHCVCLLNIFMLSVIKLSIECHFNMCCFTQYQYSVCVLAVFL